MDAALQFRASPADKADIGENDRPPAAERIVAQEVVCVEVEGPGRNRVYGWCR